MTARILRLGGATADLDAGVIRASNGRETALRPKTTEVLRALATRPGEVVAKEALIDAVWPGIAVVEDSLVQCVGEIRAALGDADRGALRTVPRRGYAIAAAAARRDHWTRLDVLKPVLHTGQTWLPVAATLLRAALGDADRGALRTVPRRGYAIAAAVARRDYRTRLDVLKPVLHTGQTWLPVAARLLRAELSAALASTREIAVRAPSPDADDAPGGEAGEGSSGADYVLGSALASDDRRVRLSFFLSRPSDGFVVWAETLTADALDILNLGSEIAQRVAGALGGWNGAVLKAELRRVRSAPTATWTAFGHYLEALRIVDGVAAGETAKALGHLDVVAAQDDGFARSHLLRFILLSRRWSLETDPSAPEAEPLIARSIELAAALDPLDPLINLKRAEWLAHLGDDEGARRTVVTAVGMAQGDATALSMGAKYLCTIVGDAPAAMALARSARRLGGGPGWHRLSEARAAFFGGDFAMAELLTRGSDLLPSAVVHALALAMMSDRRAIRAHLRLKTRHPDLDYRVYANQRGIIAPSALETWREASARLARMAAE